MLWPDAGAAQARASLRQTIKRLRADLACAGFHSIEFDRHSVRVVDGDLQVDADRLLQDVEAGKIDETLLKEASISSRFLASLDGVSSTLDAWLSVERTLFADRMEEALERIITRHPIESSATTLAGQAMMLLDPTNEAALRQLMRSYWAKGNPAAAVRAYDRLYGVLEDEYDIEPELETAELVADIKMGEVSTAPQVAAYYETVTESRPIVFVEPFTSSEQETLSNRARAFRNDLIAILVRFREWIVVDRIGSEERRNCYVLEGSEATLPGGASRLSFVLRSLRSGRFLWSEHLPLTFESWRENQMKIAQRFALSIQTNISTDRLRRGLDRIPSESAVFDRWLHCQNLISNWTPTTGEQVAAVLQEIIEVEPLFAPAHAELAALYNSWHLVFPGSPRTEAHGESAMRHARTALEIDPLETRSQRVIAWAYLMNRSIDMAEMHFEHALDLNAANAYTAMSTAQGLAFCGRTERALDLACLAKELQPVLPPFLEGYLVGIHFLAGDYVGATLAAERAEGSISNLEGWKAAALWHLGEKHRAAKAARLFVSKIDELWCSDRPATEARVFEWFRDAFPISDNISRSRLNSGLRDALSHAGITCTD